MLLQMDRSSGITKDCRGSGASRGTGASPHKRYVYIYVCAYMCVCVCVCVCAKTQIPPFHTRWRCLPGGLVSSRRSCIKSLKRRAGRICEPIEGPYMPKLNGDAEVTNSGGQNRYGIS